VTFFSFVEHKRRYFCLYSESQWVPKLFGQQDSLKYLQITVSKHNFHFCVNYLFKKPKQEVTYLKMEVFLKNDPGNLAHLFAKQNISQIKYK